MNEIPPAGASPSPPAPEPRRGIFLRVLLVGVAPALLLAVAGVLIARSISPDATGPLAGSDFVPLFGLATVLALLLALLLAIWIDLGIRNQLRVIFRALKSMRAPELRGLSTGGAWGMIGQLAEEAQSVLGRVEEGAKSTRELEQIHRSAEELIEKIRSWEETEDGPDLPASGPLAALAAPLAHLARRLRNRDQEAREAAALTMETAAEARARMERAGKETERATVEVAALRASLGEVGHLAGALSLRIREAAERETAAASRPAGGDAENPDQLRRNLDLATRLASALSDRFEDMERRTIRAALQQAAGRLLLARWNAGAGEAAEPPPELPRLEVDELRQIAGQARESADSFARLAEHLDEARSAVGEERPPEPLEEDAGTRPITGIQIDLSERLDTAIADARSKGERLAALAERAHRHALEGLSASQSTLEDLRGLSSRFQEAGGVPPDGAENADPPAAPTPEPGPKASARPPEKWPERSTPLRLLTREDVLPDEEPAAPPDSSTAPADPAEPPGKGVGDV